MITALQGDVPQKVMDLMSIARSIGSDYVTAASAICGGQKDVRITCADPQMPYALAAAEFFLHWSNLATHTDPGMQSNQVTEPIYGFGRTL